MQVAGLHFLGDGAAGALGDDLGRVTQVLHVQRRVFAGQLPHGLRQPAQVLERVVAGQHAVGVGRAGQQRGVDLGEVAGVGVLQGFAPGSAVDAISIRMTHAVHVEAGHLRVTTAHALLFPQVGGLRRFTQTGAVAALLIGKHPGRGPALGFHSGGSLRGKLPGQLLGVEGHAVVGFLDLCDLAHRLVDPAHHDRELVAVGAGHADEHVQTWALQLGRGQHRQARHAPGVVPARLGAHGVQRLRLHHALVAHGFAGPQRKGDFVGPYLFVAALVLSPVLLHPRIKRGHAGGPGLLGGSAAGVEPIQVAAGGQAVGVAHRVAAVAGFDVLAVERSQEAADFLVLHQRSVQLLGALGQRQQHGGVQHLGFGPVGHGRVRQSLRKRRVLRAQVQPTGRLRVGQGHLQPAGRAGRGDFFAVQQKHLVNVFAQRVNQRFAQGLHHRAKTALCIGHLAKHSQAQRLRGLRDVVQIGVQQLHEASEVGSDFVGGPADVAVELVLDERGHQPRFQFLFDRAGRDGFPVVHQVVHLMHPGAKARRGKHGRRVADQHGAAPALGSQRLAQVVHDVGVDVGQVTQGQQGVVGHRQTPLLAGCPLQRAMGAHMHHRAGLQLRAQPEVGGQVVVAQRHR